MTGAELAAIRSPLTGPPDANNNGPTPRFVGDLWWCTVAGGSFTANSLYEHDGTAWRWVATPNTAPLTNSLGADVALNNTASYFDGPSVAQGSTGTWFASGTVTVTDSVASGVFAKLWDGATVIASGVASIAGASQFVMVSLSGFLASPAGNLRISVRNPNDATGTIKFNTSSNSKDSTITARRVG